MPRLLSQDVVAILPLLTPPHSPGVEFLHSRAAQDLTNLSAAHRGLEHTRLLLWPILPHHVANPTLPLYIWRHRHKHGALLANITICKVELRAELFQSRHSDDQEERAVVHMGADSVPDACDAEVDEDDFIAHLFAAVGENEDLRFDFIGCPPEPFQDTGVDEVGASSAV